ncbi:effector-associated domain EAD1-containing protein [Paraflavitalea speifideaquila]|uniref:effector-associated domain EAD1-containing protein n=1 Tax=Paraflavitalea speifideaquila TaxID=3076558 RepID=UPI0028E2C2BB|nr:effector-associated domain EAD1-containing protein [Paraflavitalea speifideiaquila]
MHPVFDSLVYPWHLDEALRFYTVLCQAYQQTGDIDTFYKSCGVYVTELPTINPAQPSGDLWKEVLNKLSTKNKLKKLTEVLLADNPVQQVMDVIQLVQNAVSAVDASVININLVILDRADLRRNLELLATENDPVKVLLIKGGPKSGKSYSRHLFELMATQRGAEVVYLYRFIIVELRDVLEELFATAGDVKAIPDGDTTASGWYAKACRRLRDTAVANNKHIWVAIDDLGFIETGGTPEEVRKTNSIMDPEIRDFSISLWRKCQDWLSESILN